MITRPKWTALGNALDRFDEFLKKAVSQGGQLCDYHVVFSMGTIVRINMPVDRIDNPNNFIDSDIFDEVYIENFPIHRYNAEDIVKIIDENKRIYKKQIESRVRESEIISVAYQSLVSSGYPEPGVIISDRVAVPLQNPDQLAGELLWMILWPHTVTSNQVTNLAIDDDIHGATAIAGECRRLDYMFPRAVKIIRPDLSFCNLILDN